MKAFSIFLLSAGVIQDLCGSDAPENGDSKTLIQFCGLLIVLAMLDGDSHPRVPTV